VAEQRRVGHAARVERAEHDAGAGVVAAVQLATDEASEQEVAEVVGRHADFVALGRARRFREARQVDRGVVDQRLQAPAAGQEGGREVANAEL